MSALSQDQVEALAEALEGTCNSMYDAAEDMGLSYDDFDEDDIDAVHEEVLACSDCDFWMKPHQLDDEDKCGHCREDWD
jgi:hypothetical protein